MSALINLIYIAASILFIFGIKMLGSAETARKGNQLSSVGMLLAVIATLLYGGLSWWMVVAGVVVGGAIGAIAASRVQMTGMPELVALFNGFGGIASLLVGGAEFAKVQDLKITGYLDALEAQSGVAVPAWFVLVAIGLAVLIGGITFTGSLIAYGKLSGKLDGKPTVFPGQRFVNLAVLGVAVAAMALIVSNADGSTALIAGVSLVVLAMLVGVMMTIPIGGGDMPVVISLLNSFSGVAAAMAGFIIANNVLVVAGCLVGASGMILTVIMCKAMNRTLGNVLFGGFGAASQSGGEVEGEMKAASIEDAFYVLEAAQSVVIIPGYGMAVAQAQHAVKELAEILEENGAEVRFAIHPVAGRMPGHMNVLLAEADVPYEQLQEMDQVNPIMPTVDVAIVIGANDVVNPAALEDEGCPIYGMPIILAHEARTVYCLKRGQGAGFSGLQNSLFFRENTRMLYGDAKATVAGLVSEFSN
ncbi:NAD(P)(+) transhydrogenase (Re/Si-specific) subunit beta [Haloferula rosea]|uniref:NAD(P) transhydrogenase subunit beta n=1 Tax=Haloferula rosea TaxID=490093 RepID=A0A934VDK4_9BACT|nr:NAD(P)(+) transhydrogenase (Re/Si-specific) subunit beta [Haloferula rosea]MBK1826369.1 NAD(P)(+) transhydrogenase (Re/Si-specific) subunit beta [Haloferula rosea]